MNMKKLNKIGIGSFGEVYLFRNKTTGSIYAGKIISLGDLEQGSLNKTHKREIRIMSSINHPSILLFFGYNIKDNNLILFTEFQTKGSLKEQLGSLNHFTDTKKLINLYGIASGMSYLHSESIIHRDLKLDNILEDDNFYPKISDFGLSKDLSNSNLSNQSSKKYKGTPLYIPPEVWNGGEWTKSGDVYSFSMVSYILLTNQEPYENYFDLTKAIYSQKRPEFNCPISECYKNLITRCWSENPSDRPSFNEIVDILKNDERFITENVDKVEFMFYVNLIDQKIKESKIVEIEEEYNDDERREEEEEECLVKNEDYISLPEEIQNIFKKFSSLKKINIASSETEIIHSNKVLSLVNLIEVLKFFDEVTVDIKYPSIYFDECFKFVQEIQKKIKDIIINIVVCDFSDVKNKLRNKSQPVLVTIDSNFNEIPDGAFYYSASIKKVIIPSSIKVIGAGAFYDCNSLEQILFENPPSLTLIKNGAFTMCDLLNNVYIPSTVTTIQFGAFDSCVKLTEVVISPCAKLSDSIFNLCISLKKITIPSSVTEICLGTFSNCKSLEIIFFESPSSLSIIGEYSFKECTSLQQIVIPSSVSLIKNGAFCNCSSLRQISIPSSVEHIDDEVFKECSSLIQISFEAQSSLNSIGNSCFKKCCSLKKITIPSSVNKIGEDAFSNCSSLSKIKMPSSLKIKNLKEYLGIKKSKAEIKYI